MSYDTARGSTSSLNINLERPRSKKAVYHDKKDPVCYYHVMTNRWKDWLLQSENDLEWGHSSAKAGFYSQACFIAQQVGEKALKAIAYKRGFDLVKSHSIRAIAVDLDINGEIQEAGKELDLYYIAARYPDGLPEGAPFQGFSKQQASDALAKAELIVLKAKELTK